MKEWQVTLQKQVYDPLSFFCNLRLGTFGPLTGGETLRVPLVPSPEPREIVLHIGLEAAEGRKVMLEVVSPSASQFEADQYYIFCTPQLVPQEAWTRVLVFGKLSGQLLNPGEMMVEGLPGLPR